MHFRNPLCPRREVALPDLSRVMEFLRAECGFAYASVRDVGSATIQVDLGEGKRQGNIQLYTTRFGRMSGNARLNVIELWLRKLS